MQKIEEDAFKQEFSIWSNELALLLSNPSSNSSSNPRSLSFPLLFSSSIERYQVSNLFHHCIKYKSIITKCQALESPLFLIDHEFIHSIKVPKRAIAKKIKLESSKKKEKYRMNTNSLKFLSLYYEIGRGGGIESIKNHDISFLSPFSSSHPPLELPIVNRNLEGEEWKGKGFSMECASENVTTTKLPSLKFISEGKIDISPIFPQSPSMRFIKTFSFPKNDSNALYSKGREIKSPLESLLFLPFEHDLWIGRTIIHSHEKYQMPPINFIVNQVLKEYLILPNVPLFPIAIPMASFKDLKDILKKIKGTKSFHSNEINESSSPIHSSFELSKYKNLKIFNLSTREMIKGENEKIDYQDCIDNGKDESFLSLPTFPNQVYEQVFIDDKEDNFIASCSQSQSLLSNSLPFKSFVSHLIFANKAAWISFYKLLYFLGEGNDFKIKIVEWESKCSIPCLYINPESNIMLLRSSNHIEFEDYKNMISSSITIIAMELDNNIPISKIWIPIISKLISRGSKKRIFYYRTFDQFLFFLQTIASFKFDLELTSWERMLQMTTFLNPFQIRDLLKGDYDDNDDNVNSNNNHDNDDNDSGIKKNQENIKKRNKISLLDLYQNLIKSYQISP